MHAIQETFHHNVNHIYNDQGKKETINTLLAGNDGPTWTNALCNEYGQLAQGLTGNTVLGTDTIDFIYQHEVPPDEKVTYGNFICICNVCRVAFGSPYSPARRCKHGRMHIHSMVLNYAICINLTIHFINLHVI